MNMELGLVIYFSLGFCLSFLIIIYNDKFAHIMGWSLLQIKKAQLVHQGPKKKKDRDILVDQYQDEIIEEIEKPAPDVLIGFFYLFIVITLWPLVCILPFFALLLDIFYLND